MSTLLNQTVPRKCHNSKEKGWRIYFCSCSCLLLLSFGWKLPLLLLGKVEFETDMVALAVVHSVLITPYLSRPHEPWTTRSMRRGCENWVCPALRRLKRVPKCQEILNSRIQKGWSQILLQVSSSRQRCKGIRLEYRKCYLHVRKNFSTRSVVKYWTSLPTEDA